MLFGVNALYMQPGQGGGEERYLRSVLATIRQVQPEAKFVVFTTTANEGSFAGFPCMCVEAKAALFSGADAQLAAAAKDSGIDVLFSPLWCAPVKFPVPVVLFALDVRRFEPDWLRQERHGAANLRTARKICANAAAIVTPSEFTRRRFLDLLDIPLNKLIVAPPGVGAEFENPQPPFVQRPYFLAVGDTRRWKNIDRLRQAVAQISEELPHHLVMVGKAAEAEPADWGANVIRIDACGDCHLAALYQHCDVYIQPSLYEGSGVTVLEAMRAGAVIATSHTGAITEVAADVPFFFNPESVPSIVTTLRWAVEEGPEKRRKRTRYGRQLSLEYTWDRCAWKVLSALKRT